MFDTELKYFIENQAKLVKKYNGKVLVIRGAEVVDVYDDELEAYLESKKKFEPGSFMIQHCEPGVEAYTFSVSPVSVVG